MNRRLRFLGMVLGFAACLGLSAPAVHGAQSVFKGESAEGEVWVSVELARHRSGEAFVPLLVAVRNSAGDPARLERSSFELVGADGSAVPLAELDSIREEYRRASFDRTVLRGDGLPVGTRLKAFRAVPAEFFPVLGFGSGVLNDSVALPNLYWTADLLYFPAPVGLDEGRELVLKVQPEGWEAPVRVRLFV